MNTEELLDLIHNRSPGGSTALLGYRGSVAHGLYIPPEDDMGTDDIDLMAIYIPNIEHYFGLKAYGSKGTYDFFEGQYDIVIYEFKKMISLLLNANPNVLSLLWLKREHYLYLGTIGEELLRIRQIFLTQKIYKSFMGYALTQLHKMERGSPEGYMGEKRKKLVDKFGYDTKNASHCIRLLRMGVKALTTGELEVFRTDDKAELLSIKRGLWSLEEVKAEAESLFATAKEALAVSPLPIEPNKEWVNAWMCNVLAYAHALQKDFSKKLEPFPLPAV